MCKLETILFDVKKLSTEEIGYEGIAGKTNVVVGTFNDRPHILNLCSESYELIPNSLVFPEIERMLNEMGIEFTACYNHKNHSRFYGDYTFTNHGIEISGNDQIFPMLSFEHSYDSSRKFHGEFTIGRLVCSNGLVLPLSQEELDEYNFENLDMGGKHSFENMSRSFATFKDFVKKNLESDLFKAAERKFQVMADTAVLNLAERIEEVVAVTGVFDKKLVDTAVNIANYESKLLGQSPNEWLVYNSINSLLFDDSVNSKSIEDRRKLDAKVFEVIAEKVFVNN